MYECDELSVHEVAMAFGGHVADDRPFFDQSPRDLLKAFAPRKARRKSVGARQAAGHDPDLAAKDSPLSLREAANTLLRGLVKESTLRAAAARGELITETLGRRIVTTPAYVDAWRKSCRAQAEARISTSKAGATAIRSGTFAMAATERALDAARATVKALGQPSNATLRAPRGRTSAAVIPLRSKSPT